ncbi:MAG: helix-turn-helix domain-containing protein [Planctomycetaceae bacterium]|nr:helix-turn-helix domain-containing protein [Planctomycetaceae bacterium]
MAKLIQLEEAAKLLGMSADDLTEMRSRNEIFGYRDGATWKFKETEIERIAQEKGITLGAAADEPADESIDFDLGDSADSDSILVSDEELGQSDESTASTIIGEADDLLPAESDLQLEEPGKGSSALRLSGDSNSELSDVELSIQSSDVLDSDDKKAGPSDTANIDVASSSIGDDLSLNSDSGSLELSMDELSDGGSELKLSDSKSAGNSGFGSAIDLELDDDDLVLGSGSGSDVTSAAADSGINLSNPSDSGLSLEEPAELAGGSGGEMLELGEGDMLEVDGIDEIDDDLQSDDDFLLTPTDDSLDEESDSGSQVIALDSEEFDDSAAQMLEEEGPGFEEETVEFTDADSEDSAGFVSPAPAAAATSDSEEAPYSIWNVLSLFFIVAILGFTGILMMDLMNNIWSWQGNYDFNSTIMDGILAMLPGSK